MGNEKKEPRRLPTALILTIPFPGMLSWSLYLMGPSRSGAAFESRPGIAGWGETGNQPQAGHTSSSCFLSSWWLRREDGWTACSAQGSESWSASSKENMFAVFLLLRTTFHLLGFDFKYICHFYIFYLTFFKFTS